MLSASAAIMPGPHVVEGHPLPIRLIAQLDHAMAIPALSHLRGPTALLLPEWTKTECGGVPSKQGGYSSAVDSPDVAIDSQREGAFVKLDVVT